MDKPTTDWKKYEGRCPLCREWHPLKKNGKIEGHGWFDIMGRGMPMRFCKGEDRLPAMLRSRTS